MQKRYPDLSYLDLPLPCSDGLSQFVQAGSLAHILHHLHKQNTKPQGVTTHVCAHRHTHTHNQVQYIHDTISAESKSKHKYS